MSGYQGDFTTANTVYLYWNAFSSDDPAASITFTGLATTDIEIYKNGSATTRSSESGYTLLDTDGTDFGGNTGIGGISIDLSDNTDAGFFAAGSEYVVIVAGVTIDAGAVNFVAGTFSIERTASVAANVVEINGDATAAANLAGSALGIVTGACEATPSTTVVQTDLAEATDDHYIGRVVVFTSGAAAGQASDITDYTGSTGTLTITAITTAPAATDTFVIV